MKLERDVKREVKKLLDQHKWFWWMIPANGYGKAGISDFHALRDGVFIAIETKLKGKKPTVMQQGFLNSIVKEGGLAFVVSDETLVWFATWLDAFDRSVQSAQRKELPAQADGATLFNSMQELLP